MKESAIIKAVDAAGGRTALAARCGVRYQAVQKWESAGAPLDRCAAIEAATGGRVSVEELRPDVRWMRDRNTNAVLGYFVGLEPVAPATDQQEAA